jgi:NCS1 family nucleobase:cation symporter-1
MYMMGWLLTFTTSAVVYMVASCLFKWKIFPASRESSPKKWEWLANEGREGFFEGEGEGQSAIYAPSTPPTEEVHMGEKSHKGSV